MKNLNVISCFDGLSGGQLAMVRAGLSTNNYYACEIDKYAMQVTQEKFPDTIQLGDVTKVTSEMFREKYLGLNSFLILTNSKNNLDLGSSKFKFFPANENP